MRRRKNKKLKKTLVVLVDGESEQIYLNNFKTSNIYIKPELPKKKRLNDLYNYFKHEKSKYDYAFWLIDLDVPIREEKINEIKNYKENFPNEIIINNPCLEFWFLLHYELKNFKNNCNDIIQYLRKYNEFLNYDKSKKEVEKITSLLSDKLPQAIENSKKRECDLESLISCSEMFKFFEIVEEFNL